MEATVRGSRTILNSPLIVGMLIDQNKPFVDNGQTEYFKSVHIPSLFFLPAETDIHAIATNFHNRIEKNIKERRYDKVIIDQEFSPLVSKSLLKKYYHLQEILKLYSIQNRQAFQLEVWLPK